MRFSADVRILAVRKESQLRLDMELWWWMLVVVVGLVPTFLIVAGIFHTPVAHDMDDQCLNFIPYT